jgi:hypothetical protein
MAIKKVYYNQTDGEDHNELTIYRNKDGNLFVNIDGDVGGNPFHFIVIPKEDVVVILKDLCDEFGIIDDKLDDGRCIVSF